MRWGVKGSSPYGSESEGGPSGRFQVGMGLQESCGPGPALSRRCPCLRGALTAGTCKVWEPGDRWWMDAAG